MIDSLVTTLIWGCTVTKTDFISICGEFLIDVGLALEEPQVVQALKDGKTYGEMEQIFMKAF